MHPHTLTSHAAALICTFASENMGINFCNKMFSKFPKTF